MASHPDPRQESPVSHPHSKGILRGLGGNFEFRNSNCEFKETRGASLLQIRNSKFDVYCFLCKHSNGSESPTASFWRLFSALPPLLRRSPCGWMRRKRRGKSIAPS